MKIEPLPLDGAFRIRSQPHRDERGWFARTFCETQFAEASLPTRFVQASASFNEHRYTLRGLHWQSEPFTEAKLVRCTQGKIFDVIVDVRPQSVTFGQWHGEVLTHELPVQLLIPMGFAHGFLTLSHHSELTYQMTEVYAPEHACGIRYNDPKIGIDWPADPVIISDRDRALPLWNEVDWSVPSDVAPRATVDSLSNPGREQP